MSVSLLHLSRQYWLVSLSLLACTSATSQSTGHPAVKAQQGLCQADEDVVFTCNLKSRRTVSICASKPLDSQHGHVQYRFGKPGRIDIALPTAKTDAAWRQNVLAKRLRYSAGGGNYLRFNQPPFSYVVYSAFGARWGEKAGVMVWKDGEMVGQHACSGAPVSRLGPAFQAQAGLGEDPDELVLP